MKFRLFQMNPETHLSGAYLTPYSHQGQAFLAKEPLFQRVYCQQSVVSRETTGAFSVSRETWWSSLFKTSGF